MSESQFEMEPIMEIAAPVPAPSTKDQVIAVAKFMVTSIAILSAMQIGTDLLVRVIENKLPYLATKK
jgi:hypothetical protein